MPKPAINPSLPTEPVHLCHTLFTYLDMTHGVGKYEDDFVIDYLAAFGVNRTTTATRLAVHRERLAADGALSTLGRNLMAVQFAVDSVRNGGNIASRWRAVNAEKA